MHAVINFRVTLILFDLVPFQVTLDTNYSEGARRNLQY